MVDGFRDSENTVPELSVFTEHPQERQDVAFLPTFEKQERNRKPSLLRCLPAGLAGWTCLEELWVQAGSLRAVPQRHRVPCRVTDQAGRVPQPLGTVPSPCSRPLYTRG